MGTDDTNLDRRKFLREASVTSVIGAVAVAGCSGSNQSNSSSGNEGSSGNESGNGASSSNDSKGGSAGEKLPQYTYLNNPANYDASRHDTINLIGKQMNELGLNASVEVFEWGTLYDRATQQFDYSFTTWNRSLGVDPGRRMPSMFHSSNTGKGEGNFTGYENKDLDPMLMEQMQTSDTQKRVDLLHKIQSTLNEDVPMHPIVQWPNLMAYNSQQLKGWTDHVAGYYHFEPMVNVEVTADHNELRGAWAETFGTLNVLGYNNETKLVHQFELLYDRLVRINNKLEPDPKLSLATEWEQPDDTTVRYKIREGHTWHDGESVTPEDVKFTLEYIKENQIPLFSTQWERYDSVEQDGQWIQVNFKEAAGPVHSTFSNQIPIIPKHKWESRSDPGNMSVKEPVGSGPLQFDYWDEGSELSLKRFGKHWNPVNFDRRFWRVITQASTMWSLLSDGGLNYLPQTYISKTMNDNVKKDQISLKNNPGAGWWHLSQNTRKGGLDDSTVRKAIVHAIPKSGINKQVLYGYATEGWNLVGEAFGKFSNKDVPKYQKEDGIKAGKKLLKDAGYTFDEDGNLHFPE